MNKAPGHKSFQWYAIQRPNFGLPGFRKRSFAPRHVIFIVICYHYQFVTIRLCHLVFCFCRSLSIGKLCAKRIYIVFNKYIRSIKFFVEERLSKFDFFYKKHFCSWYSDKVKSLKFMLIVNTLRRQKYHFSHFRSGGAYSINLSSHFLPKGFKTLFAANSFKKLMIKREVNMFR